MDAGSWSGSWDNLGASDVDMEIELRDFPSDFVYGLLPACHEYCSSNCTLINKKTKFCCYNHKGLYNAFAMHSDNKLILPVQEFRRVPTAFHTGTARVVVARA